MMMKLCFLSLLIEDVLAIGGFQALGMDALAGNDTKKQKKTPETPKETPKKTPETPKETPKKTPETPEETPKKTPETPEETPKKTPETPEETADKPSTETSDGKISCGGHDADSCGACITAPGAPTGKEAASWCNGDCYVEFKGAVASCMSIQNGFVSCGHHQAAECETCTNEAVGAALFCNGVCAFNDTTNKCLNK